MKKILALFILISMLVWQLPAFAGYSSYSSYRSSYSSSYSRPSYSSRSTYSAPRTVYRSSTPVIVNRTTVVQSPSSSGGVLGNPFFWMFAMNHTAPAQPPVIIQQVHPQLVGQQPVQLAPQPVATVQQPVAAPADTWSAWDTFLAIIAVAALVVGVAFAFGKCGSDRKCS